MLELVDVHVPVAGFRFWYCAVSRGATYQQRMGFIPFGAPGVWVSKIHIVKSIVLLVLSLGAHSVDRLPAHVLNRGICEEGELALSPSLVRLVVIWTPYASAGHLVVGWERILWAARTVD